MKENEYGELIPHNSGACPGRCDLCRSVCPFADGSPNEDEIGRLLFKAEEGMQWYNTMGWVRDTYAGRLADNNERMLAASGGMTTAVLLTLMERGEINAAIVVHSLEKRPWYRTTIAESREDILASRGSVYHVIDFSETLREVIRGSERRYAVVALPCVVKAIRLAQNRIPRLRRRIPFLLGLTCGGCRSRCFTDLAVGLTGMNDGLLRYRSKRRASQANDFSFAVESDKKRTEIKFRGLYGFLWMNGVGELKSCLFCDDIFAELADLNLMDAWLPEYMDDSSGRNLVISRNRDLSNLIEDMFRSGICEGQHLMPSLVEASQLGVIEKKRTGLPGRCEMAIQAGWTPQTRYGEPDNFSVQRSEAGARRLQSWDIHRKLLAHDIVKLRNHSGPVARIRAWFICLNLFRQMRRLGMPIYNRRAIFFMEKIHPRAFLRNLVSRVMRRPGRK